MMWLSPPGIFCQADREPLQQIPLQQVGPETRGVVITDSVEAAPFLRMPQPVSKYGLALLILDHAASNVLFHWRSHPISRSMHAD